MIPEPVLRGEYPDTTAHPLWRLEATCLKHWAKVVVGEPFRWTDENIRLAPEQETSFEQWEKWRHWNRLAAGFPFYVKLDCRICEQVTKHIPEGRSGPV